MVLDKGSFAAEQVTDVNMKYKQSVEYNTPFPFDTMDIWK